MAKYFNANQIKQDKELVIALANGLSVMLSRLPSGSLRAYAFYHNKPHSRVHGAPEMRKLLAEWEQIELKNEEQEQTKTPIQPETKEGETVAYARVSTADQKTDRQLSVLMELMPSKIFEEKISGKNTDRPELNAMIDYVRDGDTVIVHSLDRLARSLPDLRSLIETLNQKGVTIRFIKNDLTFKADSKADAASLLMLNILGAIAEFERELIKERQREGVERAKAKGVYKGRPKDARRRAQIKAMLLDGETMRTISKELNCSTKTVQSVKNEIKQSQ